MPVEFISFSPVHASLSAVFLPFSAVPILFSADLNSSLPYLDVDPSRSESQQQQNKKSAYKQGPNLPAGLINDF